MKEDSIKAFIANIIECLDNKELDVTQKRENATKELSTLLDDIYVKESKHFDLLLPQLHRIVELSLKQKALVDDFEAPYHLVLQTPFFEQLTVEQKLQFYQQAVTNLLSHSLHPTVIFSSIFYLTKSQAILESWEGEITQKEGYESFQIGYYRLIEFLLQQFTRTISLNDKYSDSETWVNGYRMTYLERLEDLLASQDLDKIQHVFAEGYQFARLMQFSQHYELARGFYDLINNAVKKLPVDYQTHGGLRTIVAANIQARPLYNKPLSDLPKTPNLSFKHRQTLQKIRAEFQQAKAIQPLTEAQKAYSEKVRILISEISADIVSCLGTPPCAFTLIGMGSISRYELTPASDLDAALLIENEACKEKAYFRAFVRLLQSFLYMLGDDWAIQGNHKQSLGLHMDGGDYNALLKEDSKLIQTPANMAEWVINTLIETNQYQQTGEGYYALVYALQTPCFIYSSQTSQQLLEEYKSALDSLYTTADSAGLLNHYIIGENTLRIHRAEIVNTLDTLPALTAKQALSFLSYWCFDVALMLGVSPWQKPWLPDLLSALAEQDTIASGYLAYLKASWKKLHTLRNQSTSATERVKEIWQEAIRPAYNFMPQPQWHTHLVDPHVNFIAAQISTYLSNPSYEKPLQESLHQLDSYLETYPTMSKIVLKVTSTLCTNLLTQAIDECLPNVAKVLLASGADINACGNASFTPLHYFALACIRFKEPLKALKLAEVLLSAQGVKCDSADSCGNPPLYYLLGYINLDNVCDKEFITQLVKLFIYYGAELDYLNTVSNKTLLESSMGDNHVAAFCLLASLGAGRKAEARHLLAFIDEHRSHPNYQAPLQTAQQQLAQQNSLFAWQLSLRRLTQITAPTKEEISQHGKDLPSKITWTIEGALTGKCYLRPEIAQLMFNADGSPKKSNQHGRRPVVYIEDNGIALHTKFYPEMPGVEEAVRQFSELLFCQGVSQSELFRFTDMQNQVYPVLFSQHVPGDNLQTLLDKPEEAKQKLALLDEPSFTELLLLTLLINPEDGKPDNYILTPYLNSQGQQRYRIIGIDNDHAFVEPILLEKGKRMAQVKTIVYCLDPMQQPLEPKVCQAFQQIDVVALLQRWLEILEQRQNRYEALFNEKDRERLYKLDKHLFWKTGKQPIIIRIPFAPRSVVKLYEKMLHIQAALQQPGITGLQLLKRAIPALGLLYEQAFDKEDTPLKRFHYIGATAYSMAISQHYQTLTNGTMILNSLQIPEKTMVAAQNPYTPKKAFEELMLARHEEAKLQEVVNAIKQGNFSAFHALFLDSNREKIIYHFDFQELPLAQQSKLIDNLIGNLSFLHLRIKNSQAINDKQLIELLRQSPNLLSVRLVNCPNITGKALDNLDEHCPILQVLSLMALPKLEQLAGYRTIGTRPLSFSELRYLRIKDCDSLNSVLLQAEQVHTIDLAGWKKLSGSLLAQIIQACTNIQYLHLKGCEQVSYANMKQALPVLAIGSISLLKHLQEKMSDKEEYPISQLDFSGYNYSPDELKQIATILERNTSLTDVNLSNMKLGTKELNLLIPVLEKNRNILKVNLAKNGLKLKTQESKVEIKNTKLQDKQNKEFHIIKYRRNDTIEKLRNKQVTLGASIYNCNEQEPDYRFKFIAIGDAGVGKTSLTIRFSDNTFDNSLPLSYERVKTIEIEGNIINLNLTDTCSLERFSSVNLELVYRRVDIFFICFDVTDIISFNNVSDWLKNANYEGPEDSTKVLIGTKIDLVEERIVSYKEAKELAKNLGMIYAECSAKENINIQEVFYESVLLRAQKITPYNTITSIINPLKRINYEYYRAFVESNIEKIMKLLSSNNISVYSNYKNSNGLHIAAEKGDVVLTNELLKRNIHIGVKNKEGKTALDIAIEKDNQAVVAAINNYINIGQSPYTKNISFFATAKPPKQPAEARQASSPLLGHTRQNNV